ncbi:hypothetical protein ISS07_03270 [Candidatus Woesearchaeota archaeon]|nr:hypothetical protein [Candidatus Woesearchaeota archaeon]
MQVLHSGIKKSKENALFVTVEDYPEKLNYYAKNFGWDLEDLQKKKKFEFLRIPIDRKGYKIIDKIEEKARKIKAKRIVIDSLSALNINARMFDLPLKDQPDPTGIISNRKILKIAGFAPFEDISQFTYLFINRINDIGATTFFITDSVPGTDMLTKDGVSEYACDGVIQLQLHDTSKNVNRTLAVKKMRGSNIIPGMNLLKFTKTGLEVGEFKAFF